MISCNCRQPSTPSANCCWLGSSVAGVTHPAEEGEMGSSFPQIIHELKSPNTRSLMHIVRQEHRLLQRHSHTHPLLNSLTDDMQNIYSEYLPFIPDLTPVLTVHFIGCLSFLTLPLFLVPSSINPTTSFAFPLYVLPSFLSLHPLLPSSIFPLPSPSLSLSLHPCPSRLQMVLNGCITERKAL